MSSQLEKEGSSKKRGAILDKPIKKEKKNCGGTSSRRREEKGKE